MTINYYPRNKTLADYMEEHPGRLIVQSRFKTDLMIHYQDRSRHVQGCFIPRSLPCDLTRQASAESLAKSDDLNRLIAMDYVRLVVPNLDNSTFSRGLDAAQARVSECRGVNVVPELYTDTELGGIADAEVKGAAPTLPVTPSEEADINELIRYYGGEPSTIGDDDRAAALVLALNFSLQTDESRQFFLSKLKDIINPEHLQNFEGV